MRQRNDIAKRSAFTLIELLVSFALILFIMTILSEAFGAAATTFSHLKAIGEMCMKLRMASNILRRDLAADHFEGHKRLSDPNFWSGGPPQEGYFRIYEDSTPSPEGHDLDNVWSYLSAHQVLQFTSKLHGNTRDAYYVGTVSSTAPAPLAPTSNGADSRFEDVNNKAGGLYQFRFTWAEIAYFLRPQVDKISSVQDQANGQPLYSLYRRHWLACLDNASLTSTVTTSKLGSYLEMSCMADPAGPTNLYFNSAVDMTMPPRRMGTVPPTPAPTAPYVVYSPNALFTASSSMLSIPTLAEDCVAHSTTQPLTGSDLLITDVISFDVRVLLVGGTDFVSLDDTTIQAYASNNPNFNGSSTKYLFDTWSSRTDNFYDFSNWAPTSTGVANTIPIYQSSTGQIIGIRAIQATIRIWDFRTQQTRQVTIVQDL